VKGLMVKVVQGLGHFLRPYHIPILCNYRLHLSEYKPIFRGINRVAVVLH
jgi:hypothetical protein